MYHQLRLSCPGFVAAAQRLSNVAVHDVVVVRPPASGALVLQIPCFGRLQSCSFAVAVAPAAAAAAPTAAEERLALLDATQPG